MTSPTIAIGLDAADPVLLEEWMAAGKLPHLAELLKVSSYGRLETYDWYRAETPWTTFLTGVSPQRTGYWSPIKYEAASSEIRMEHAFNFREFPPFYAYAPEAHVTIFDMPQAPLVAGLNGEQVLAWGTHSGQTESVSLPPELWEEIAKKHGRHPLLNEDGANCYSLESMQNLADRMKIGIERRKNAFLDLIKTNHSDFALTIFGEAHVAGHYFWHLSQPHPLSGEFRRTNAPDLLLSSFQAIDDAIGEIVEESPEDATIVVFSAHGMGSNVMDLPSVVFLPEFLYRWSFPGHEAIGTARADESVPAMIAVEEMKSQYFADAVWKRTRERNPLLNVLKRVLPKRFVDRVERRLPKSHSASPHVASPWELREQGQVQPFQPATWFMEYWPTMKAFALPSFSEGYIRINVKGRDATGVVEPEDYEKVCDEIIQDLNELIDSRSGRPMVARVIRTRTSLAEETEKSPDADLVVVWQEETAADTVESPKIGRIGPLPFLRTGSHRAGGFLMVHVPGEKQMPVRDNGHAVDLAPSLIKLMGAEAPPQMEGTALF